MRYAFLEWLACLLLAMLNHVNSTTPIGTVLLQGNHQKDCRLVLNQELILIQGTQSIGFVFSRHFLELILVYLRPTEASMAKLD